MNLSRSGENTSSLLKRTKDEFNQNRIVLNFSKLDDVLQIKRLRLWQTYSYRRYDNGRTDVAKLHFEVLYWIQQV
jgi:hypothetical protein